MFYGILTALENLEAHEQILALWLYVMMMML